MNTPRETIYAALFALAGSAASFACASRRTRLINEVPASQLPALFMQQVSEAAESQRFAPTKYTLRVDFAIYVQNPDSTQPAAPLLNPLVDAVEAALAPPVPGQPQTLGGLVSQARVSGEIAYFEGNLGNRAGAIIPIEIVTT